MHHPQDERGDAEGVSDPGDGVGELVCELDVVAVEPAARDEGEAVEACDAGLGEETGEEVADYAADGVGGEDLYEGLVGEDVERGGKGGQRTSRASSYPARNLSWVAKLQIVPARNPNRTAAAETWS